MKRSGRNSSAWQLNACFFSFECNWCGRRFARPEALGASSTINGSVCGITLPRGTMQPKLTVQSRFSLITVDVCGVVDMTNNVRPTRLRRFRNRLTIVLCMLSTSTSEIVNAVHLTIKSSGPVGQWRAMGDRPPFPASPIPRRHSCSGRLHPPQQLNHNPRGVHALPP